MSETQWYYAIKDEQFGPLTLGELKQLAESGRLSPDDLLWREGMEAWTTAINLRGLFGGDERLPPARTPETATPPAPDRASPLATTLRGMTRPAIAAEGNNASLASTLRTMQLLLWSICVLVVLAGLILFTRAFMTAKAPADEAHAAAVYSAFFIAAYVLARAGEKLSRLLTSGGDNLPPARP